TQPWPFMAGVRPATLRAVAAQRVLTDRPQIKRRALSEDRAFCFICGLSVSTRCAATARRVAGRTPAINCQALV
ncbi:hypothetical protein CU675_10480, partial [Salmonella enterica subsp. enterica serovar Typhimurium]